MKLRWISNTYDPNMPNWERTVLSGFNETQDDAVRHHKKWLEDKVIGEPMPSDKYTVEQMKSEGLVGVYVVVEDGEE